MAKKANRKTIGSPKTAKSKRKATSTSNKKTSPTRKNTSKSTATTRPKPTKKTPRRKGSSALKIQTQHVDFLTYKVDQLRKFYGEILEFQTEIRDTEGLNYLEVRTSPTSTLGFMPPHPEMRGEQPLPREPTLYFVVKDVDKAYAQLMAKGAAFVRPPQEMPWGYRVVTTTDPEGRSIMLASKLGKRRS